MKLIQIDQINKKSIAGHQKVFPSNIQTTHHRHLDLQMASYSDRRVHMKELSMYKKIAQIHDQTITLIKSEKVKI